MLSSTCFWSFCVGMWNLIDGATKPFLVPTNNLIMPFEFLKIGDAPKWRQKLYIWEGETTMNCIQAWLQLYWTPRNRLKKNNQKRDRPGHRISNLMGACTKCSNHVQSSLLKMAMQIQPSLLLCKPEPWYLPWSTKKYVSNSLTV